jgi:large subunit ribosomal protein L4
MSKEKSAMIEIPVFSNSGEEKGSVQVDPEKLGGKVHMKLLKEAIVMYQANRRQGTADTKQRSDVAGSTRKLYRQKGTGRARAGMIRTPSRRGGGRAFGPHPRDFGFHMPKKARRLATHSALLAKLKDGEVKAVESLALDAIRTKSVVAILKSLKIEGSCLLVTAAYNRTLLLSARNIPGVSVAVVSDLNAYDVLKHRWLVVETAAVEKLTGAAS